MPVVTVTVDHVTLEGDYSDDIPSVLVTCSKCGNDARAYGTTDASVKRCIVELRDACPDGTGNYYHY